MNNKVTGQTFHVGIDVGSSYVHAVVLDQQARFVFAPKSIKHFANPLGGIREAWQEITAVCKSSQIKCTAFTGSGAHGIASLFSECVYLPDSVAIPMGVGVVCPEAQFVFHIGAKDAYFFNLAQVEGKQIIQEWCTGTKCGGGSGTLIEKQCRRLYQGEVPSPELADTDQTDDAQFKETLRITNRLKLQQRLEQMYSLSQADAAQSQDPSEFLARCGVVVQSDLIHKQNEGASRIDNMAGLFHTVARNYKVDTLGAREFDRQGRPGGAIVTGGVMNNVMVQSHLSELLGIELEKPDLFQGMAALGAAVKAIELDNTFVFTFQQLDEVASKSRDNRKFEGPLIGFLNQVNERSESLDKEIPEGLDVVIGIDGGSTTTKGALVEVETGRLLDKLYIKTHGNPEGSLKEVLTYLSRHKARVNVLGVGATGSARKLYEKILVSQSKAAALKKEGIAITDRVTDEITCHAMGVRHNNPDTDTIFEIGGQDMKFTRFADDGTVKDAKMNYSCQAGSGQTLENMADIINLDVEDSLQTAALRAQRVPIIDATCGVFMEMDENRLVAEGFSRDEIAAAIVRGTAASYFYKFVGGAQHVGNVCSAQGGPPLGKAFLAALAQVTKMQIEAYPHREMFGAWGQALDIVDTIKRFKAEGTACDTAFRGWDVVNMNFDKRTVTCKSLYGDQSCGMRDCVLEVFAIDKDEIITGGFCPIGNSEGTKRPKINYVDRYHTIFEKHFKRQGCLLSELTPAMLEAQPDVVTIGIKRSTATLGEKGIWSATLLKELGFCPVISPRSDSHTAKIGIDKSRTEYCIASKLATGHAALLNNHALVEYLFNPSFIEQRTETFPDLKYCIYTESEGYVLNDVLSLDKRKQLNPILHFGDLPLLAEQLQVELTRVGCRISTGNIKKAIAVAEQAEQAFRQDLFKEGDRFLERVDKNEGPAYVGLGRDYVLLDPEASSHSGTMFANTRGLDYIPQLFLEHRFKDISLDDIVENEYWVQSVKILKASLFVAGHPRLFGIRLINFACGPDSLKIYQERRIQECVNKPLLVLVTDGQTNNAPFVTRTEAHERVVSQAVIKPLDLQALKRADRDNHAQRTWLVPFMGNASITTAASLRHFKVNARVVPTNTPLGYELACKHLSTEVCHPLRGVVGDILGFLMEEISNTSIDHVRERYLVMMPTTSGPCRFGKYTELMREFLDNEDLKEVPVLGPSSKTDYIDVPFPGDVGFSAKLDFQKLLFRGIKGSDLLEDTYLRFRPYAKDKNKITSLRQSRLDALEVIIEQGGEIERMVKWGEETVRLFEACDYHDGPRFPLVLYIGEIYMRQHDPYTDNVIDRLENVGLELVRDPVSDWLHYINSMNRRNTKRDLRLGIKDLNIQRTLLQAQKFGKSLLKGMYLSKVEEQLAQPFHEVLQGRHILPKPIDMIETMEKVHEIHGNIEGESPLSTGIAYHLMHDLTKSNGQHHKVCGIFHIGPFTCMQESVATAKTEAMVKEYRKIKPDLVFPIIHAFFGDSPNANLDSEIAVFKEQCYQKRTLLMKELGPAKSLGASSRLSVIDQPRSGKSSPKKQIPIE